MGSLMAGGAGAAGAVRQFQPSLSPGCADAGTQVTFTATLSNSSSSNQVLGSALLNNSQSNGFKHVKIVSTTAPSGKTWVTSPGSKTPSGIHTHATASASSLAPGESVSVTFTADAPSVGTYTWKAQAWQGTTQRSGASFKLAPGASNPQTDVRDPCGIIQDCPSTGCTVSTGGKPTPDNPNVVTVHVPGGGDAGQVSIVNEGNVQIPGCGENFGKVGTTVTINVPSGYGQSNPIIITFSDDYSVAPPITPPPSVYPFCKTSDENPNGSIVPTCSDNDGAVPCIDSQSWTSPDLDMVTVMKVASGDPRHRH